MQRHALASGSDLPSRVCGPVLRQQRVRQHLKRTRLKELPKEGPPGERQCCCMAAAVPAPAEDGPSSSGSSLGGSSRWHALNSSDLSSTGEALQVPSRSRPQGKTEQPKVPWGFNKIFQVMGLWLLAYLGMGQILVPTMLALLGVERDMLSARGHALLHLGLDAGQLLLVLGILWACLRAYKPRALGLFPLRWDGGKWLLLVLAGCFSFPVVDWLAQQSLSWFPGDGDAWSSAMEASLMCGDWVTNGAYLTVVGVCAPLWEEAIFRGFLLASLARLLPPPAAALTSALLFAAAHLRTTTFAPLLLLGLVFAGLYQRADNLLPPIVLHSLWNLYVLFQVTLRPVTAVALSSSITQVTAGLAALAAL